MSFVMTHPYLFSRRVPLAFDFHSQSEQETRDSRQTRVSRLLCFLYAIFSNDHCEIYACMVGSSLSLRLRYIDNRTTKIETRSNSRCMRRGSVLVLFMPFAIDMSIFSPHPHSRKKKKNHHSVHTLKPPLSWIGISFFYDAFFRPLIFMYRLPKTTPLPHRCHGLLIRDRCRFR